jgi:dTDP-4-dehydrorhamnose reductase
MTLYSPKLLITGGQGQLAMAIANHSFAKEFNIVLCGHADLDINQPAAIEAAIATHLPDIIINTAAYTAVDKAEEEVSLADRTNHIGTGQLALLCNKHQIKLVHISTDYIFNGNKEGKYSEDDIATPINIYGKSKWEGENEIRHACKNHMILRVSGVFSEYGNNFLKTMLKLSRERTCIRVVSDQVTCPTYAGDIAHAILMMCNAPSHKGTYHFSSSDPVSWHEFAQFIINEAKQHESLAVTDVTAVTSAEYPSEAKRPPHSVLDCQKIKMTFNIDQPSWQEAVKRIVPKLIREQV